MKWCVLAFVLVCFFVRRRTLTRRKIMRRLWLDTIDERLWFANQFSVYYVNYRKSVVLYALRRLSWIFQMPLTTIDGSKELLSLFEVYKARQTKSRQLISRITPQPDPTNPLQIISDDYSDAWDYFESAKKNSRAEVPVLTPLREHATVADYVRFIVEYDTMQRQVDRLRVTSILGVSSP